MIFRVRRKRFMDRFKTKDHKLKHYLILYVYSLLKNPLSDRTHNFVNTPIIQDLK